MEKSALKANSAFAPVEGPVPSATITAGDPRAAAQTARNSCGANNEQLPERLQAALRRLAQQYSVESDSTRRREVRRIKQAHNRFDTEGTEKR